MFQQKPAVFLIGRTGTKNPEAGLLIGVGASYLAQASVFGGGLRRGLGPEGFHDATSMTGEVSKRITTAVPVCLVPVLAPSEEGLFKSLTLLLVPSPEVIAQGLVEELVIHDVGGAGVLYEQLGASGEQTGAGGIVADVEAEQLIGHSGGHAVPGRGEELEEAEDAGLGADAGEGPLVDLLHLTRKPSGVVEAELAADQPTGQKLEVERIALASLGHLTKVVPLNAIFANVFSEDGAGLTFAEAGQSVLVLALAVEVPVDPVADPGMVAGCVDDKDAGRDFLREGFEKEGTVLGLVQTVDEKDEALLGLEQAAGPTEPLAEEILAFLRGTADRDAPLVLGEQAVEARIKVVEELVGVVGGIDAAPDEVLERPVDQSDIGRLPGTLHPKSLGATELR
jgi:hypothetical protein